MWSCIYETLVTHARDWAEGGTYSCRSVNGQHTLRLIIGEEGHLTDFVLMQELSMRPGLYGSIDATEAVEQNYNVSLSIDETQENSIPFKEMGVSK